MGIQTANSRCSEKKTSNNTVVGLLAKISQVRIWNARNTADDHQEKIVTFIQKTLHCFRNETQINANTHKDMLVRQDTEPCSDPKQLMETMSLCLSFLQSLFPALPWILCAFISSAIRVTSNKILDQDPCIPIILYTNLHGCLS